MFYMTHANHSVHNAQSIGVLMISPAGELVHPLHGNTPKKGRASNERQCQAASKLCCVGGLLSSGGFLADLQAAKAKRTTRVGNSGINDPLKKSPGAAGANAAANSTSAPSRGSLGGGGGGKALIGGELLRK